MELRSLTIKEQLPIYRLKTVHRYYSEMNTKVSFADTTKDHVSVDPSAPQTRLDTGSVRQLHLWEGFQLTVRQYPDEIALNVGFRNTWHSYSWAQYYEEALCFARGLIHCGFGSRECVVIASKNSPETCFANMGTLAAGGIVSHCRMDCRDEQLIEMTRNSKATVFVVQDIDVMLKVLQVPLQLPDQIKAVIVLDNSVEEPPECDFAVYNLTHFQHLGHSYVDELDARIEALHYNDTCIVSYHYNASGNLHGAMFSHDNVYFTARMAANEMHLSKTDRLVGYLPLFHVTSQVFEIYMTMYSACQVFFTLTPNSSLGTALQEIEPTIFGATPSTWDQILVKLLREKSRLSQTKSVFYKWAKNRAISNSRKLQYGSGNHTRSIGHRLADHMVLRGIKIELGLARCRACYALLAPMDLQALGTFNSVDIPIYQTLSHQEISGFATLNVPHSWTFGSSGKALRGTQLHINPETNEVYFRGRHIFQGYHENTFATHKKNDDSQWLHSGLRGLINPDGFLLITDSFPDYVVLSTGDLVPPVPYEKALVQDMPELKRALVVGDSHSYLVVLFVLKTRSNDRLAREVIFKGRDIGSKAGTTADVIRCPFWAIRFDHALERINANVHLASHKIRKWYLLSQDFTVDAGELNPANGEPRRAFIQRKYKPVIDTMYIS